MKLGHENLFHSKEVSSSKDGLEVWVKDTLMIQWPQPGVVWQTFTVVISAWPTRNFHKHLMLL